MEYKILEANGVENENVDGAAFNNFCAGYGNGIIKGILEECKIDIPDINTVSIATGELILSGFRVKLISPYIYKFPATPAIDIKYQIVARITLNPDKSVLFDMVCREIQPLVRENLFKADTGIFEEEIARFVCSSSGTIESYSITARLLESSTVQKYRHTLTINDSENMLFNGTIELICDRAEVFDLNSVEELKQAIEKTPYVMKATDATFKSIRIVCGFVWWDNLSEGFMAIGYSPIDYSFAISDCSRPAFNTITDLVEEI